MLQCLFEGLHLSLASRSLPAPAQEISVFKQYSFVTLQKTSQKRTERKFQLPAHNGSETALNRCVEEVCLVLYSLQGLQHKQ